MKSFKIVFLLLVILCPCSNAIHAQDCETEDSLAAQCDTCPSVGGNYDFKWKKTVLPLSLVAVGSIAVAPNCFWQASHHLTSQVLDWRGARVTADDYVQYLPVAGAVLLDFTGLKARHGFRDRVFITATSYAALGVLTNVPKWLVDEKRPEYSSCNSFPSGHTATVFMGAELVRIEYGTWSGVAAYAVATGVGVMRMYNGRHWFHDVVAGAGIGIMCARLGEWSAPLWQRLGSKWCKRRDNSPAIALFPAVSPFDGGTLTANVAIVL